MVDAVQAAPPTIAPLRPSDLEGALRLSDSAGWNQTAADWRRLLDLQPDGAWGAWQEGRLVGSATLVAYPSARSAGAAAGDAGSAAGEVHWIGMVLVLPEARGHGIGGGMLRHVLDASSARKPRRVGLDATSQGAGLYERHGFAPVREIDRWAGTLRSSGAEPRATPLDLRDLPSVARADARRLGLDREPLLRSLAADPGVRAWRVGGEAEPTGYAFLRPGRTHGHLGPVVAEDARAHAALLDAAAEALDGRPVFVDAVRDADASAAYRRAGLSVARRLTRMTLGDRADPLTGPGVRAATGFEWG